MIGCLAGTVYADAPETSDPNGKLPVDTQPGPYPTTVTATNIQIAPSPGSSLDGTLSNSLKVKFLASGPYAWTESRHNEGDLALLISPALPNDPSYYPPDAYVENYQPYQDGSESNSAIAWRVNRDAGALFATVRHNGVNNQDLANGSPLGITHGVAYFNADLGQGWGFHLNDGEFANGGAGSADLQMGVAGNDGGAGEASFSVSATYLPYDQGWLGAWVNSSSGDEAASFTNGSPLVDPAVASWIAVDGVDLANGALGHVELPDVNSAQDGMLFVAPTSGNNSTNIAAGVPRDGGWDIAVREDNDTDFTGQTIGVNESGYQFVYVPYSSANLIGGEVKGNDGSLIHGAGLGRMSINRHGNGEYGIAVTDILGNRLSESDGTLMLSVSGFMADNTTPSRSFLSYEYNAATKEFVVQARQLTATNSAASENVFGDALSLTDTNFYFAFVDFKQPLSPHQGQVAGDYDSDGALTTADINLLMTAIRGGSTNASFDLNGDHLVNGDDRVTWVEGLKHTYIGDANLDGQFDSEDFVAVFVLGEYEDDVALNSNWASGDWDGNGEFDSSDFVEAFTHGGYEAGPRAAVSAVPEPQSILLLLVGAMMLSRRGRRG